MRLIFRVMDSDVDRLKATVTIVAGLIRKYDLNAEVFQVTEMLEHGRQGVADALPALEINSIIVSKGRPLTQARLVTIFDRLADLEASHKPHV